MLIEKTLHIHIWLYARNKRDKLVKMVSIFFSSNKIMKINEYFTHFSIDSAADLCIGLLSVASKNRAILAGLKKFFFTYFFKKKQTCLSSC